ncbi:MAG TPA: sugar-transfer associated ATP-grasp domain-containing protein [Sphingobacteriaceae bacterium]
MEKFHRILTHLSYFRRVGVQLLNIRNLRYFHLIFKGYTPNKGYYFDFKKYGYNSYVKDTTRYLKTVFYNYNNRDMMDDKYACYLFLKEYSSRPAPVYALIENGICHFTKPVTSLTKLLETGQKFVIKPRKGRGGEGVKVLEARDGRFYFGNREFSSFHDCFTGVNNHVLNPYIDQHSYASSIYPNSLNTIRLLTAVLDGRVILMKAGHRFGAEHTGVVDNFSQGGIFANIDLETGLLERPTIWNQKDYRTEQMDHHPSTHATITGVAVPRWQEIVSEMLDLHQSILFIKYVGWDIAVTADGFYIIEANYASDLIGLQLHTPLLINDDHKKFFSKN